MNEGGGSAHDLSGNNNTGTLNGGLSWTPSSKGTALSFGNGGQYASAVDSTSLRFGGSDFTLIATLRGTSSGQQSIVDKRLASGAQTGYTIYATNSLITIQLNDTAAAHGYQVNYAGLFNGAWNTLAVAISRATNTANFYINGTLIAGKSIAATVGSLASNVPLIIGASNGHTGGLKSALLATLAFYPFQLSAAQAWQLYQRPYAMLMRRSPRHGFIPGLDHRATFAEAALTPRFNATIQATSRYSAAANSTPREMAEIASNY